MAHKQSFRFMRTRLLIWSFFLGSLTLAAQPQNGLIAYYNFDACDATENTGLGSDGIIMGNATCGCGASGSGLTFDGNTSVQILGNLDLLFTNDFTISFFFLPDPQGTGIMDIMSKSEICGIDSTLEMRYNPNNRELSLNLSQQSNLSIRVAYKLPVDRCYHHIAFVRRDRDMYFYYDGVEKSKAPSSALVRIINDGILTLGAGPCLANGDVQFRGVLDELRFYSRALTTFEVQELYIPVDKITSPDTVLFTGSSMQVKLPVTCASSIQWSPSTGVSNTFIAEPTLTPPSSMVYDVNLNYGFCMANDSIKVTIADSSDLDCDHVFFPTGFTPNGDNINDDWGFSNTVFLGQFQTLEVYDRWGGQVFSARDAQTRWDGSTNGDEMMPGQYTYVFTYTCEGETHKKAGSVVMIK